VLTTRLIYQVNQPVASLFNKISRLPYASKRAVLTTRLIYQVNQSVASLLNKINRLTAIFFGHKKTRLAGQLSGFC